MSSQLLASNTQALGFTDVQWEGRAEATSATADSVRMIACELRRGDAVTATVLALDPAR